jgi:hypothetical protein
MSRNQFRTCTLNAHFQGASEDGLMSNSRLSKSLKALAAASLLSIFLVACGSDDNADGSQGSDNAPVVPTTAGGATKELVEGGVQGTEEPTSSGPTPTIEFKMVPATPLTIRRGSSGELSTNATPAASPGASPEASPEAATPESE